MTATAVHSSIRRKLARASRLIIPLVPLMCLLLGLISTADVVAQWRRVGTFEEGIFDIIPLDSGRNPKFTALVGGSVDWLYNDISTSFPKVWKTTNGGASWKEVFELNTPASFVGHGSISSFSFLDSSTGWCSATSWTIDANGIYGGCFMTADGGETWKSIIPPGEFQEGSDVYFNHRTGLLHFSTEARGHAARFSTDTGKTWQTYQPPNLWYDLWSGYAFLDSLHGMVAADGYYIKTGLKPLSKYYLTSDGGYSWQPQDYFFLCFQPIAYHGAYYNLVGTGIQTVPLDSSVLYKSIDSGKTWQLVHAFDPTVMSLVLMCDSNYLYAQTAFVGNGRGAPNVRKGIFRSSDQGMSWSSICGPENFNHSRFRVTEYGIWAGSTGPLEVLYPNTYDLWYNRTKKANADRLQFVTDGAGQLVVPNGKTVRVPIHYTHTAYYEPVDSLSFALNYSDALVFDHDSAWAGWAVLRHEDGSSSVRIVLRRTDPAPPMLDSQIATLFFRTFVTPERSAFVALDEINFNQDTTFRECMVASLTKNDTLFIDLTDACGDSVMREYLRHDGMLQIGAIRPNPSSGAVTLSLHSEAESVVEVELVNALGAVVADERRAVVAGANAIELPTSSLPNGVYYVRARFGGKVVGASVVIER